MLRFGRLSISSVLVASATMAAATPDAEQRGAEERTRILEAAARVMTSAKYCALITLDAEGQPQARAMDPFPPEVDSSVWLATHRKTRKVGQIRANPRVTLFYLEPAGAGYVALIGEARLVSDPTEKSSRWKPVWKELYEDENRGEDYLLIHVSPRRVEVMSLPDGIPSGSDAWKPAIVDFSPDD